MSVADCSPTDSMFSNLIEGTQLMSIYIPYFYIIQEVSTGMYYAGAKWGKDANPDNFMVEDGYTTSSGIVNDLISKHGLDHFTIRKMKKFKSADEAYNYETKFLQKIDARKHPRFYNGHNNDMASAGTQEYKQTMLEKYGVDHNMKVPELQKSRLEKIDLRWGSYSNMIIETGASLKSHAKCEEKYGNKYAFLLPHAIKAKEETNMLKYGVKNLFQSMDVQREMRRKGLITFANNYNERQQPIIEKLINSDIDFTRYGWVTPAAEIIGIQSQKVKGWMLRNIPDFYENNCYKRNPPKR